MHFYFGMRGILQMTELFKMYLQTQFFPWKRKNLKTGKEEITAVQGSLRECLGGIYEYVFPEECLDIVLTIFEVDKNRKEFAEWKKWVIRKALGNNVEAIPKKFKKVQWTPFPMRGFEVYPIGIKKDARLEKENWGFEQEML